MKNIMAMSAAKTYDLVNEFRMHAFPDKDPYPNEDKQFFIPVGPNGRMEYVYKVVHIAICDPEKLETLKDQMAPDFYQWLQEYDTERRKIFGYSENVDFKFYFLLPVAVIRQPFNQTIRNSKAFSFKELPLIGNKTKVDPITAGRAWIFSYNTDSYPLHEAIHVLKSIDWDVKHVITSGKVQEGDVVYLYGTRPEQAIYYRCRVIKANKTKTTVDETMIGGTAAGVPGEWAELEQECAYMDPGISYQDLLDHGLKAGNLAKRRIVDDELVKFFNEYDADSSHIVDYSSWDNYATEDETEDEAEDIEKNVIDRIEDTRELLGAERETVVKARVNQSFFRKKLLAKYGRCCLCGMADERLLVASHIKPWKVSDEKEKLDAENGMLLCPSHDRLFDTGLISFDNRGKIMLSASLNKEDVALLNVNKKMSILISEANEEYFKYHRENVFKREKAK